MKRKILKMSQIKINKVLKEPNGDPGVKKHNDGKEKFNKGAQQEN